MPDIQNPEQIRRLQTLQKNLNSAESQLSSLEKELLGQGIINPVVIKKKDLIRRLEKITLDLFDEIPDEDPILRARVIENIEHIILLIPILTKDTQEEFKEKKFTLNNQIKALNAVRDPHQKVTTLHYGRDLFTILDVLATAARGVMTVVWAWNTGISAAAERTGLIFYPINAAFIATAALFNFLARGVELLKTKRAAAETDAIRAQEKEDAAVLLKTSAVFRFFIFALQVASALAFAGVLSTPLGWAFVAGATLFTWVDEMRTETKTTNANLKKFQLEHMNETPLSIENQKTEQKLIELISKARYNAAWKFVDVIAMALIACGPIPPAGPLLGMIGLAMLAIVPVKKVITAIHEKYFKKSEFEIALESARPFESYEAPSSSAVVYVATLDTQQPSKKIKSKRKRSPVRAEATSVDELTAEPHKTTTKEWILEHLRPAKKPKTLATEQEKLPHTTHKKLRLKKK